MAVTSVELHWTGASGSHGRDGKRKYESLYRVYTDDPLDQAAVIIAYFAVNGPYIGDAYTFANDIDLGAFCDGISPRRQDRHATSWDVMFSYSELDESDRDRDENGDPTDDPLLFYDDVQVSYAQFNTPVEQAINRTALPDRPADTLGPVVNSLGEIYDPPLERDQSRTVVRIKKNLASYADTDYEDYQDSINESTVTISKPFVRYTATWQPYQAKLQNVGGTFRIKQNIKYWEVDFEIHVWRKGWRQQVIDRGFHALARVGDPDGHGGIVGFAPDGSALDATQFPGPGGGVPAVRRLLDVFGEPVAVPMLLNGAGQVLPPGDPPFLITYSVYDELDWGPLNL